MQYDFFSLFAVVHHFLWIPAVCSPFSWVFFWKAFKPFFNWILFEESNLKEERVACSFFLLKLMI